MHYECAGHNGPMHNTLDEHVYIYNTLAMVMVVVEDVCLKYHGHMYYLLAVYFILPELFVVVDYCCHGDGSGGVHLYTKYITTRTNY